MNDLFDPTSDFEDIVDGLEGATLTHANGQSVAIEHCLRRAIATKDPDDGNGKVRQADTTWHLPAAALKAPPQPGDIITDSRATTWHILEVEHQTLGRRWRCLARQLEVDEDLGSRITIQRAAVERDAHGASVYRWLEWKSNVPARIQPLTKTAKLRNDARRTAATHVVALAGDIPLGGNHRLVDRDGRTYEIEQVEQAERIGELMKLFVRETPPPGA